MHVVEVEIQYSNSQSTNVSSTSDKLVIFIPHLAFS